MSRIVLGVLALLVAASAHAGQYIVCTIDRHDEIKVVSSTPLPLAGEDRRAAPGEGRIDVTLLNAETPIYRTSSKLTRTLRAEFASHAGAMIEGRHLPLDEAVFVVRIPDGGDTLELQRRGSARATRIAIRDLPKHRKLRSDAIEGPVLKDNAANSANRIDLLIMGDGYTAAQQSKFIADANALKTSFFQIPPYSTYANYVNVLTYFVASPQSGADHPHCADGGPDPLEGTFVNTAFDATFCTSGIQRLLTVNTQKVVQAAAAVPEWNEIFVIVNDDMYGGAGGFPSVVSTNQYADDIAPHEYGHTFTGLGDEYTSPYPGFPDCNDPVQGNCEPNVTNATTRAALKWAPWVAQSTPVPTPDEPAYFNVPGLFQGARYFTSGYYRPRHDCLMRSNGVPFCEVCAQTYVLRLYDSIDMIEPGTESPAPGSTNATAGVQKTFSAAILQPVGGPAAQIRWYVNDALVANATSSTFNWTPPSAGTFAVSMRVKDMTSLVHPAMAGSALDTRRDWTVSVAPGTLAAPLNFVAAASTSSVALSWSPVSGASGYEIARANGGGFTTITTIAATSYNDTSVASNTGYLYKVRAVGGAYSAVDLATVFTATDDPLAAGTRAKALHVTQLRTAINAARAAAGLTPATYTHSAAVGTPIRTSDLLEMRNAANAARTAAGLPSFSFTDALTAQSTRIRNVHVSELRAAIR